MQTQNGGPHVSHLIFRNKMAVPMSAILSDHTWPQRDHNFTSCNHGNGRPFFVNVAKCALIRQDKLKSGPSAKYSSDTHSEQKAT